MTENNLPGVQELLDCVNRYSPIEPFSTYVTNLLHALEPYTRQGKITGWSQRLLLYEQERRKMHHLPGRSNVAPARSMRWKDMEKAIQGQTVVVINGKFRNMPTGPQLAYVWSGLKNKQETGIGLLIYEPQTTIHHIFDGDSVIFPRRLREIFWQHIPNIDVITCNKRIHGNVFDYWVRTHERLSRLANDYTVVQDKQSNDHLLRSWSAQGARIVRLPLDIKPSDSYLGWSTTNWDSVCTGTKEFVKIAQHYLIPNRE